MCFLSLLHIYYKSVLVYLKFFFSLFSKNESPLHHVRHGAKACFREDKAFSGGNVIIDQVTSFLQKVFAATPQVCSILIQRGINKTFKTTFFFSFLQKGQHYVLSGHIVPFHTTIK